MTMHTDFKRIARSGFINFYRNGVVSATAVLMMTVTLLVIGVIVFTNAVLGYARAQVENKVDINIYFYPTVTESQVTDVKKTLEQLPEVRDIVYTSREDALLNFKERHANDYLTLQALEEIGTNPFGASLGVHARSAEDYEHIAEIVSGDAALVPGSENVIQKINYYQNKEIIGRLSSIIQSVNRVGGALTIFFIVISILITFNTIRLAIYMAREEISVMRLVGAENKYISGPFLTEGILSGAIAALVSTILFYPITLWISRATEVFFGGFRLVEYYGDNFIQLLVLLLAIGMLLGVISSFLAVRKYLKK